jgi:hypothetical protein
VSAKSGSTGSFSFTALPIAFGLAIAFALGQLALFFAAAFVVRTIGDGLGHNTVGSGDIAGIAGLIIFTWAHALFVLMVADAARDQRHPKGLSTALLASVPLAAIFVGITVLDSTGAAYGCAEGQAFRHNEIVPMWPWLWIGWLVLTFFALPARLLAWVRNVEFVMTPIWLRSPLLLLGALPVWLLGYVFQNRVIDCSGPHEGWGLFEGGVFVIPMFGAFLFATCTSMAMLSAAFVRPVQR